ncbi:MAG TPA: MarR family transcriptional regulator [Thermoanaerobaculia bacterium]|nr:MarR family transcriptional regulator [Thermoanaerobaculia bacterium]
MSAPTLHRTLALLGSEKRLLVLQLLVDGPFTVGEVAKTLDFSQDRASHLIAELEATGLVRKTRKGQRVEAAVDRGEILRFIANLGENIYPGGVNVKPRSILDLDGQTLTDALTAERVVVYDDPLPEVGPDGADEAGNPYELAIGVEGLVPPDPFIDGWDPDGDWEVRELKAPIQNKLDDDEEVIDAT